MHLLDPISSWEGYRGSSLRSFLKPSRFPAPPTDTSSSTSRLNQDKLLTKPIHLVPGRPTDFFQLMWQKKITIESFSEHPTYAAKPMRRRPLNTKKQGHLQFSRAKTLSPFKEIKKLTTCFRSIISKFLFNRSTCNWVKYFLLCSLAKTRYFLLSAVVSKAKLTI